MTQPRPRPISVASSAQLSRPVSKFWGKQPGLPADAAAASPGLRGSAIYCQSRDSCYSQAGEYASAMSPAEVARQSGYFDGIAVDDDKEDGLLKPAAAELAHDFYADFAGVGPRYAERVTSSADLYAASMPSPPPSGGRNDTRTSLLYPNLSPSGCSEKGQALNPRNSVLAAGELFAAPELGKEWSGCDEAHNTRPVKDRFRLNGTTNLFSSLWKSLKRWFAWKRFIFVVFAFCACLGALSYFLIPRTPGLEWNAQSPLNRTDTSPVFTRVPTIFEWDAKLNIAIDGQANWIPFKISSFFLTIYDVNTGKKVGNGGLSESRTTFPGRDVTPVDLDLHFYYRADNVSDPTWQEFYQACSHKYENIQRPGLRITVEVDMSVKGVVGSVKRVASLNDVECPIELPAENA